MIALRAFLLLLAAGICGGQTCRPGQIGTSVECCDGAAGSLHARVFIRNKSRTKCLLKGASAFRLIDQSGRALPIKVKSDNDVDRYGKGSGRFLLHPGSKAAMSLSTIEPNFDRSRCGTRLALEINGVGIELKIVACGPPGQPVRISTSGFYAMPEEK